MHWRDRDRLKAKERMRRRRAEGLTEFDRARNHAIKKLIEVHRAEFNGYQREFLWEYLKEKAS